MKPPLAIISSTIAPRTSEHYGRESLRYDPDARLEQTRTGIQSLLALGIEQIYLADNSGPNWREGMERELYPAQVQVFDHHPYRNKGISEVYLLLAALAKLPAGQPIIKLSGRYQLQCRLDENLGENDLVARESRGLRLMDCYVSTIAYAVRDSAIYERLLRETLRDMFGFPSRIVGPRSMLRVLRNSVFPDRDDYPYHDPPVAIEHATWRAARKCGYRLHSIESLGVAGITGQTGEYRIE